MSVAASVANGSVDTGLGIRAAANALNLDFVPVAEERYDLIVPQPFLDDPKVVSLLDLIGKDEDFKKGVLLLGGYNLRDCGKVMYKQ